MKNYIEIWNHGGRFSRCRADRPPLPVSPPGLPLRPHTITCIIYGYVAFHYYYFILIFYISFRYRRQLAVDVHVPLSICLMAFSYWRWTYAVHAFYVTCRVIGHYLITLNVTL